MNERKFADLKEKAAETTLQIGRCYENGDGVGKDEAEAVKWYRIAAEQGNARAMIELGKCYTFGIRVRKTARRRSNGCARPRNMAMKRQ